ncbi:MAG: hypothetical protein HQL15_10525 [Candidatus Omnitrophica bacterium]|nr:hypothetical protein [Candidatus Omnitrophota bacterium]
MKKVYGFIFLVASFLLSVPTYAAQSTLTTYYPAPVGNYGSINVKEIKIGNLDSECTDKNEGALRYNSDLKLMQYCNGQAWTVLGVRMVCPWDYHLVGTPGSIEAFCVENKSEDPANLPTAIQNCLMKQMHLCSEQEWMTMCLTGPKDAYTDHLDWVFSIIPAGLEGGALIMSRRSVGGPCSASATQATTKIPYRCCFH